MDIHAILEHFRQEARSNRDLGDRFERLVATWLKTDPVYAELYDGVWLWADWAHHRGQDTGVDIVARERLTGDYHAIQCKFFDPGTQLQKEQIDAFFTTSGKSFPTPDGPRHFTHRIIVSTTDKWSKNAEDALVGQAIPVTRLGVKDLADSPVDWGKF